MPAGDDLPAVHGMTWESEGGGPRSVTFETVKAFQAGMPLAAARGVRGVTLWNVANAENLATDPGLASITDLTLSFIPPKAVLALLASPHLSALESLAITPRLAESPGQGSPMVAALAHLPALGGLRTLHLNVPGGVPLGGQALDALARSPRLTGLRELSLTEWRLPDGLGALWQGASLKGLTSLDVFGWHGDTAAENPHIKDLGDGGGLPALERFSFRAHDTGGDPASAVARARRWTALRELTLMSRKVGDAGARALARAAHLTALEVLDLSGCRVGDDGVAALEASPHFPRLRRLILDSNPASPERIAAASAAVSSRAAT